MRCEATLHFPLTIQSHSSFVIGSSGCPKLTEVETAVVALIAAIEGARGPQPAVNKRLAALCLKAVDHLNEQVAMTRLTPEKRELKHTVMSKIYWSYHDIPEQCSLTLSEAGDSRGRHLKEATACWCGHSQARRAMMKPNLGVSRIPHASALCSQT
jgi:hypothetical protein